MYMNQINFTSFITEQYLNKTWDDLAREQTELQKKMKDRTTDEMIKKEKNYTRQLLLFNKIMTDLVKLRNLRKDLDKLDVS
jgi:hypothetical protein